MDAAPGDGSAGASPLTHASSNLANDYTHDRGYISTDFKWVRMPI